MDSFNNGIKPKLIKPKPFNWYIMNKKDCLGLIWFSKTNAQIIGDNIPNYYKDKEYLFINLMESSKKFKGIGTQLIKAIVKQSKKLGLEGRVCLNTTTINPKIGTPVPFYHKLGFKSASSILEEKITQSIAKNESIPKECEATTMFLPKESIKKLLS